MGVTYKGLKLSEAILKRHPTLQKGLTIKIGVAAGSTYPNGQSVGDVATYNEYGTDTIPARPFIAPTAFHHGDQWGGQFGVILKSSGYDIEKAGEALGNLIVGQVKEQINAVTEPPLAPATIKARQRKDSKATDKPLIDTGLLFNSITYSIKKK